MSSDKPLHLWAFCCAHVGSDIRHGRESLADALRQSESSGGFEWDLAVNLGDLSGAQGEPTDEEGQEVVRQYSVLKRHRREQIYDIGGNHDRSDVGKPEGWWVDKWIDPTGSHTDCSGVDASRRPYPVHGNWERYQFRVGNLVFLMMSDRNEPSSHLPREVGGGNPSGVVSQETFDWWKQQVQANADAIVISAHHYMLKNTTVASGDWEGCWKDEQGKRHTPYHGYKERGTPIGASYLYFVGGKRDSGAFEQYLAANPGASALWLGGHTHAHPDDTTGNKSHIETRWGTHFVNISALTRHHAGKLPISRRFTFTPGSDQVQVRCYLHTDEHAPQGWYKSAERTLQLPRAFAWS